MSILIRLLGLPTPILAIVAIAVSLGLPRYFVGGLTKLWDIDSKDFAKSHPSRFLGKMREIRRSGTIMELAGVAFAVILITNLKTGSQLSDVLTYASVNFSLVEFVLMASAINFWHPDPRHGLLASLDSETDPEKGQNVIWLDGSLEWFNSILSSQKSKVVLKGNLNLESLLFDSTFRHVTIRALRLAAEEGNTTLFIEEVAYLAHKYPNEILERNSLAWKAKTQLGTILAISIGIIGIVITLSPILIPSFGQVAQLWFNLVKS